MAIGRVLVVTLFLTRIHGHVVPMDTYQQQSPGSMGTGYSDTLDKTNPTTTYAAKKAETMKPSTYSTNNPTGQHEGYPSGQEAYTTVRPTAVPASVNAGKDTRITGHIGKHNNKNNKNAELLWYEYIDMRAHAYQGLEQLKSVAASSASTNKKHFDYSNSLTDFSSQSPVNYNTVTTAKPNYVSAKSGYNADGPDTVISSSDNANTGHSGTHLGNNASASYGSTQLGNDSSVALSSNQSGNSAYADYHQTVTVPNDNTLQGNSRADHRYDNTLTAPSSSYDSPRPIAQTHRSYANMLLGQLYAIINYQPHLGANQEIDQTGYGSLITSLNNIVRKYNFPNPPKNNKDKQGSPLRAYDNSLSAGQPSDHLKKETTTTDYRVNLLKQLVILSEPSHQTKQNVDQSHSASQTSQTDNRVWVGDQANQKIDQSNIASVTNQMANPAGQSHHTNQRVDSAGQSHHANQMVDPAGPMVDSVGPSHHANQMVDPAGPMVDSVGPSHHANQMVDPAGPSHHANQMVDSAGPSHHANQMVDSAGPSHHANQIVDQSKIVASLTNQMVDRARPSHQTNIRIDQTHTNSPAIQIDDRAWAGNQANTMNNSHVFSVDQYLYTTPDTSKPRGHFLLFDPKSWNVTKLSNVSSVMPDRGGRMAYSDTSLGGSSFEHTDGGNTRVDQVPRHPNLAALANIAYVHNQMTKQRQSSPWQGSREQADVAALLTDLLS